MEWEPRLSYTSGVIPAKAATTAAVTAIDLMSPEDENLAGVLDNANRPEESDRNIDMPKNTTITYFTPCGRESGVAMNYSPRPHW